ncbi:hypothetical protein HXX76_015587 [Chlamydomonas incerta]|uniref:PLAT domain-containing protein n=1 Tax=Chlamydomonas incerta TaxID=51695 RepID=A0A835VRU6_CHLIN|nr:hypothetical protein HXX76_015587 [Chlamydomonas incerta]|eukprot:KAG2423071.1 hypothetical protein HXX76_015587 [Chlamydomonas incerta]
MGMTDQGYMQSPFSIPGRQPGILSSRLQCVEVVRLVDGKHFLFLPPPLDPDDAPNPAATKVVLRVAAQPHFRIATFTSAIPEASTDARVYIDLFGGKGQLLDLYLRDATGDSFDEGSEDVFFFPDPGLGEIGSVCISHDDSGDSPNWHLDHIEITNTGTGKTAVFLCQKWLGLGVTTQQDEKSSQGRVDPERVLERVLYPTHLLASLNTGRPLMSYHTIFNMESQVPCPVWHAAEALQLVGWNNETLQYSETVIIDSGRLGINLELDTQYVQHVQAMNQAAARRAAADTGEPAALVTPVQGRTYQVVVQKLAAHRARSNIAIGSSTREVSLVLSGALASSRLIQLNSGNCTNIGVAPFTLPDQPDTFQVTTDVELGQLLRADVRLGSSSSSDWGILLSSVVVRDIGGTNSAPVEFTTGPGGQWLGMSPNSREGVYGGTQALHLLPVGTAAVSFVGRAFQTISALHLLAGAHRQQEP